MATLNFKGKPLVWNHHLSVPYHQLVPQKDKSLTQKVRLDDNLIVHGDNLKALKALLPLYGGKVKCVYIDPPYNTGSEGWVYNDAVNAPMIKDWLGKTVDRDDLTRHDKWLCMMTPRLKLLREMLRDDGVICVSIDDNEVHHLKSLMDEVFGEENFRNIIIVRRGAKNVQAQFETMDRLSYGAEYVLVYTKTAQFRFPTFEIELEDAKPGAWNSHWRGTDRPKMREALFGIKPKTGQWRWGAERNRQALANYARMLEELGKGVKNAPSDEDIDAWYQARLAEGEELDLLRRGEGQWPEHYVPPSDSKFVSSHWADLKPNGSSQLQRLFGRKVFDNPKSIDLIRRLISFTGAAKGDIVMDGFAGSGATAHAVLALNAEAEAGLRFVLIEAEDYADSLTAERARRVIAGVPRAKLEELRQGVGGSFSFYSLGDALELEALLSGKGLPSFKEMARFAFHAATAQTIDESAVDEKTGFIGSSAGRDVYLIYKPKIEFLRTAALTLDNARALKSKSGRRKVVFAPTKYLDQEQLDELAIDFAQLPYDLYTSLR